MTGRRLLALASVAALLLPVFLVPGAASGSDGKTAAHAKKRPLIKSGRYGDGDLYMDVDVKKRSVLLTFTLFCDDIFVDQYVSTGATPSKGELDGNRVGAEAFVFDIYTGPAASGPGKQSADWTLKGKFTRPTHFEGSIYYEAVTSPEPTSARPQCLDTKKLHLDLQPPS